MVCAQIAMLELRRDVQLIISTRKWLKGGLSVCGRNLMEKKGSRAVKVISHILILRALNKSRETSEK